MAYQVLARKWRPQLFEDVLGQQAVTRTLKNALKSKRIAQAFVFSGPRGCGKTTTARILARALSCVTGPTPEPCGVCDACLEIAEGRDIDVLEIDAATHTGVDNVREVIIEGLAIAPVRNRYKVFIIDEVHMLSGSSFNALLKSIEEPPPHVIFMMATTEQHKIPDTVLSRSQLYEFRTISAKTVAERLRKIATEEKIEIPDEGLMLLARAGEGSMRDSLSAFDQVRAFAGDQIAVDDVVTVLGLVGRDLVFDLLDAVVAEDAPAAFALVERAIERGYDLRLLCRELARATRDLLILSVDPKRAADPDVTADAERERMLAMSGRWSREDLLRAFDLLTKTEQEIRVSDQPRYNLEMALLRLMHLRKLVPLSDLLSGASRVAPAQAPARPVATAPRPTATPPQPPRPVAAVVPRPVAASASARERSGELRRDLAETASGREGGPAPASTDFKDRLLSEVKATKSTFYNIVVAAAYSITASPSGVVFSFLPKHKMVKEQADAQKPFLQSIAERLAGQPVPVSIVFNEASESAPAASASAREKSSEPRRDLAEAPPGREGGPDAPDGAASDPMSNATVQAVLEIFPVEKTTVEER